MPLGVPWVGFGNEARGIFAFGNKATGIIAVGNVARGVVTFGNLSIGSVFALGNVAVGLVAVGNVAVAPLAAGGASLGLGGVWGGAFAVGMGAIASGHAVRLPIPLGELAAPVIWGVLGSAMGAEGPIGLLGDFVKALRPPRILDAVSVPEGMVRGTVIAVETRGSDPWLVLRLPSGERVAVAVSRVSELKTWSAGEHVRVTLAPEQTMGDAADYREAPVVTTRVVASEIVRIAPEADAPDALARAIATSYALALLASVLLMPIIALLILR